MTPAPAATILLGTISLDRYLDTGLVLPGGGILNMAWRWRHAGRPFRVLTRIGSDDGAPILDFLARHGVELVGDGSLVPGASSWIDIEILDDRQPHMDHFVAGVFHEPRLGPADVAAVAAADRVHLVLVEGAILALEQLGAAGALAGPAVSADFLGFRHYTVERFAATMRLVDVGFVGWPGSADDPEVRGIRGVAHEQGRLVVVTMGARAVEVFDGRPGGIGDRTFPTTPVAVAGTTLGCGDAFIAGFLDAFWSTSSLDAAVAAGARAGAETTAWFHPLPDDAYPSLVPGTPA